MTKYACTNAMSMFNIFRIFDKIRHHMTGTNQSRLPSTYHVTETNQSWLISTHHVTGRNQSRLVSTHHVTGTDQSRHDSIAVQVGKCHSCLQRHLSTKRITHRQRLRPRPQRSVLDMGSSFDFTASFVRRHFAIRATQSFGSSEKHRKEKMQECFEKNPKIGDSMGLCRFTPIFETGPSIYVCKSI